MQSSPPFISFTSQEEKTKIADDDRHRGNEEVSTTISKENISASKEKHVKTTRDEHDSIPQPSKRRGRRKLSQFPEKLMRILDSKEYEAIFSWNKKGNAIVIYKPYDLVSEVLTTHFEARDDMKFDSFVRKLYRWGFSKLVVAEGEDIYFHPHFRQGDQESCSKIVCTSKPSSTRPRRQEQNDMPLPYNDHNETLDLARFQSQILSSSLSNGDPLHSNARLSPQNQGSGASFPVNHNNGALADSFLGNSNNTAAPKQHQWYDNNGAPAMTPDEMNLRLLHMNTMINDGGQSSVSAADMQHQQMGSCLNPIQNHHQQTGREGLLPASVPNSLTTSQQNITLSTASSSPRMPGHIPFQPPSFLHGTTLFQNADYSQLLGYDNTNMTMSQEIEELRKGNDLILQLIKNLLRHQSILPRQHMPQLLSGINITSTPTSNSIIDSAVQRQPNNNILLGGTNLIQNRPNEVSTTHAASDHIFREFEALQHAKRALSVFQSDTPVLDNNHQSDRLVRHDTMVPAGGITLPNNGFQTNFAMGRAFQQQPEESNILSPAPDQSKSPPADRSQAGSSIMSEKLRRSSSGPSSQRRRFS